MIVIPTSAIVSFTFEKACDCCGHPEVKVMEGGIGASGYYKVELVTYELPPIRATVP